jgi:GNAT superfamily N-acetyltransferase
MKTLNFKLWVESLAGDNGEVIRVPHGRIDIQHKTQYSPRSQSVIDFVVDEEKRGQGIGDQLLKAAMAKYKDLGGQVSSLASLKVFYNNGFRNPDNPNMSFEELVREFKLSGSIFMAVNHEDGTPYA